MATSKATTQARKVQAVVAQTGATERQALSVLEAKGWRDDEAVLSIRAEFTEKQQQRVAERQSNS
jgi:hypothetical protein